MVPPVLLQKSQQPSPVTVCWERGNTQTYRGLLDAGCVLILLSSDLMCYHAFSIRVRSQEIKGSWPKSSFGWSTGLRMYPLVISPFHECLFRINTLGFWNNSHIASWFCEIEAITVEKWELLKLPSTLCLGWSIKNSITSCGQMLESSATLKNLKDSVVVVNPICPTHKTDGSWRMTIDNPKINQVFALV